MVGQLVGWMIFLMSQGPIWMGDPSRLEWGELNKNEKKRSND